MERDWTYFVLIGLGVVILWLMHRYRQGSRRGFVPIVAAILAVIGMLYLFLGPITR